MNIKSLLIGSAAALVAVSGARAADAIIAAEPEPVEYVRVCDAFGTGFFYIPGTETCLRVGGYVRVQNDFVSHDFNGFFADTSAVSQTTRAHLTATAMSDTEYGVLEGFMALQVNDEQAMIMDEAYIQIGGFRMGRFWHWNDRGLSGETDGMYGATTRFNSIRYQASSGAFTYGVSMDQYLNSWATSSNAAAANTTFTEGLGVSGIIGGTFGAVTADVVGFYDTEVNEGGVRFLASADFGPGTFGVQAAYATDANLYITANSFGFPLPFPPAILYQEWLVGADYSFQATDKLKLGVGAQYASVNFTGAFDPAKREVGDIWKVGMTADYAITEGLALKATVNYETFDGNALIGNIERDTTSGFIRLQRSF